MLTELVWRAVTGFPYSERCKTVSHPEMSHCQMQYNTTSVHVMRNRCKHTHTVTRTVKPTSISIMYKVCCTNYNQRKQPTWVSCLCCPLVANVSSSISTWLSAEPARWENGLCHNTLYTTQNDKGKAISSISHGLQNVLQLQVVFLQDKRISMGTGHQLQLRSNEHKHNFPCCSTLTTSPKCHESGWMLM